MNLEPSIDANKRVESVLRDLVLGYPELQILNLVESVRDDNFSLYGFLRLLIVLEDQLGDVGNELGEGDLLLGFEFLLKLLDLTQDLGGENLIVGVDLDVLHLKGDRGGVLILLDGESIRGGGVGVNDLHLLVRQHNSLLHLLNDLLPRDLFVLLLLELLQVLIGYFLLIS